MEASTAPPGYITDQQGGQAAGQGTPVTVISQQAAGAGNHYRPPSGHVGPVIGVLAVIAVLGILAGLVGRLCGGRSVMGYGPRFDVEAWLEAKCSSCLDGHVAPPRHPPHPHMHMNTHIVMESIPAAAAVPVGGSGGGDGGGGGGWRSENVSLRSQPHPVQRPHPHSEVLLRPLPTQQAPPAAVPGRPEAEIRVVRDQEEKRPQPMDDGVEDEDDISDFSDHSEEDHHHDHDHDHDHDHEQQQRQRPRPRH